MNILQTETLKGWGGQQNKVINECRALLDMGHRVWLICNPGAQIAERACSLGIEVLEQEMNKRNFFRTIPFFLDVIKREQIDLLITHGSTDSWIGGLAGRLSRRRPVTLRERHNLFPIRSRLARWLHRSLFHGVLAISDAVADYLQEIGVSPERIHYLPDAVDIEHFAGAASIFRQEFHIPQDAVVVGTFTALRREKGVWDCFEVAKQVLRRSEVWFVFGGKQYPEIEAEITTYFQDNGYALDRVVWTGFRNDAPNVLAAFDIFLYPSHSEGLGTVILEAMASGLPIVVYDRRPMSDLVRHEANGLVAPFGDTVTLTDHTLELIRNAELRRAMGTAGQHQVRAAFDYPVLSQRLAAIIERTCSTQAPADVGINT